MRDQLRQILGREVHLVEQEGLRSPFRRQAILSHREVMFAA
jgi:predicted nucleotidyltransferase